MADEEKFVFWDYDLFPYYLGGTVVEFKENGLAKVREYGGGLFRPVLVLPLAEGKEKLKQLEGLRDEYHAAAARLHDGYMVHVRKIIGDLGEEE